MKNINKIVLGIILLSTQSISFAQAENFVAITITPSPKDGVIADRKFEASSMAGIYLGRKNLFSKKIGAYIGGEIPAYKTNSSGNSTEVNYSYKLINAGLTYSPNEKLSFLAGAGYSYENAEFVADNGSTLFQSLEDNDQVNFNAAVMYKMGKRFGVIGGFNSAPKAYNIGISYQF